MHRFSPLVYTLANILAFCDVRYLEYVYVIKCASVQLALLRIFFICISLHSLQVRFSHSPPLRLRHLSLTASTETMFAAPTAAAATSHLDRRERSLRAAAATRDASSAVAAMSRVQGWVNWSSFSDLKSDLFQIPSNLSPNIQKFHSKTNPNSRRQS